MIKNFLDARSLEHPEPLELAIEALKSLDKNSYFYMLHRKEPIPLLALASEHNLNFISHQDENSQWHILISQNQDINLQDLINPLNN